jgi:hypothetical protein
MSSRQAVETLDSLLALKILHKPLIESIKPKLPKEELARCLPNLAKLGYFDPDLLQHLTLPSKNLTPFGLAELKTSLLWTALLYLSERQAMMP